MVMASLAALSGRCEFVEASSGLEAIERLALGPIELMVLDLNMPDMHGLEVLGFVRSHSKYRQVPVIILTTRGDDASRSAALEAGATAYMTKPFTPGTLVTKARELLEQGAR
jgi:two-component system chemotaxis response regulator CheY